MKAQPARDKKERPILFSGPMVRAILAGEKTQTRRVMKPQLTVDGVRQRRWEVPEVSKYCPYGQLGDCLWVREAWARYTFRLGKERVTYRADLEVHGIKWRPSIFLPRTLSRITLEITEIRVERLQEIGEADAKAEGMPNNHACHWPDGDPGYINDVYRRNYASGWNKLNAKRGFAWDKNPWVWVLSFRVVI